MNDAVKKREYIVTIWPTGYEYKNEIYDFYKAVQEISMLSEMKTVTFDTSEKFLEFIYKVYERDSLSREILRYKSNLMINAKQLKCAIFKFIFDSKVEENELDESVLNIKTEIRKIISAKMDNYYYDNLLHVTDVKTEFEYLLYVMTQYGIEL